MSRRPIPRGLKRVSQYTEQVVPIPRVRPPPSPSQRMSQTRKSVTLPIKERKSTSRPTQEEQKIEETIEQLESSIYESQQHVKTSSKTAARTWEAQVQAQQGVVQNLRLTLSKLHKERQLKEGIQQLISETVVACRETLQYKDLPRIQQTLDMIQEVVALLRLNKMPELRKWETLLGIFKELYAVNQIDSTIHTLLRNVEIAKEDVERLDAAIEDLTAERNALQGQLHAKETSLSQKQREAQTAKDRYKKVDDALKANQRKALQDSDRIWAKLQREMTVSPTRRKNYF